MVCAVAAAFANENRATLRHIIFSGCIASRPGICSRSLRCRRATPQQQKATKQEHGGKHCQPRRREIADTRFSSIASSPVTLTNSVRPCRLESRHRSRQQARIAGAVRFRLRSDSQPLFQASPHPCRAPLIDRLPYLPPGESGRPSRSAPKRSRRRGFRPCPEHLSRRAPRRCSTSSQAPANAARFHRLRPTGRT